MTIGGASEEVRDRVAAIETLVTELERLPDPAARATAAEAIRAVLELHGAALDRMLELIVEAGGQGESLLASFARDDLVANVLLLHGLHPVDLADRVAGALDSVRPYLASHGGDVELLGVEDGVVRLRLQGSCRGCPSSAATLKSAIEEAILGAAPDVVEVRAEGVAVPPVRTGSNLVPLPMIAAHPQNGGGNGRGSGRGGWVRLDAATAPGPGEVRRLLVGDVAVVVCRDDAALYAYRAPCPGCGDPLDRARLVGGSLVCPVCARAYDVRAAGRCPEDATRLEPLPLLEEGSAVRVAITAGMR